MPRAYPRAKVARLTLTGGENDALAVELRDKGVLYADVVGAMNALMDQLEGKASDGIIAILNSGEKANG